MTSVYKPDRGEEGDAEKLAQAEGEKALSSSLRLCRAADLPKRTDLEPCIRSVSLANGIADAPAQKIDAFAVHGVNEVQYKTMPWWQVGALMIAEIISLGILALPYAIKTLGLIPGLIALLGFGVFSLYAGYIYGKFREKYTHVTNISDAGGVLFGRVGEIIFGIAATTVIVFIVAAHIGSFSIALNVITDHPTCTIVWALLGTFVSICCSLPRHLGHVSYLSIISCISITSAAMVCMISIAVVKPAEGDIKLFGTPTFAEAMTALLNIILAYAGHVTFFGFIAESKKPSDFFKSVIMMQISSVMLYVVFSVVVYYYAGSSVLAPALSSAPSLIRKIAYGLALPTIVVSGVINGHIAAKNLWVALWRKDLSVVRSKSRKSNVSWILITVSVYITSWLIAEAIPSFHQLLALVSALFMGFFSYGVTGFFGLKLSKAGPFSSKYMTARTMLNVAIIVIGTLICICGLIASGKNLAAQKGGAPFSCADNSTPKMQGQDPDGE